MFRVPSLRNVALTYPYMHDGSVHCDPSLQGEEKACAEDALRRVIRHYMAGGKEHPVKDTLIRKFTLSEEEQRDLVEFLKSLTDRKFVSNPALSDPFAGKRGGES